MSITRTNIKWQDVDRSRSGHYKGRYRGVDLVAVLDKANGCSVSFLSRTMRSVSMKNLTDAKSSLTGLLRRAKDAIDAFLGS